MPSKEEIRIGHSPDSDDAFMFYALAKGIIPTGNFNFIHVIEDIESLNKRAINGELEVTAISVHAYAYVADKYALLPCGASIGDGYGPIIVAAAPMQPEELQGKTIAIPGTMTTAYLTCRLFLPDFAYTIVPFNQILASVVQNQVDAGLIIHEGQVTYSDVGLHKVSDLGKWWHDQTGLPLPLGANAIRKDLGVDKMRQISDLLKGSIQYALEHRAEALDYAMTYARGIKENLADRFVGMYVNDYTLDYGEKGRVGVRRLLEWGYQAGVIRNAVEVEFVD
ncbi:TPA: ABC transporter substrate-binding protein [Candidatus Poribacteria bacterium]|nr:ABC transporter substrate-binding protein [Candidatus Poribacteria bacterium]